MQRSCQLEAFTRLDALMKPELGAPSDRAAEIVLAIAERATTG